MADEGYLWDENKMSKVWNEHAVSFYEAIQACEDPYQVLTEDPQGHEERFMIVGRTEQGRILQVLISDEELPVMRLITAFDAEPRWIQEWEKGNERTGR